MAAAKEVRLWLEVDCDVWAGLGVALSGIPCLEEVVVRTRPPHTFTVSGVEWSGRHRAPLLVPCAHDACMQACNDSSSRLAASMHGPPS